MNMCTTTLKNDDTEILEISLGSDSSNGLVGHLLQTVYCFSKSPVGFYLRNGKVLLELHEVGLSTFLFSEFFRISGVESAKVLTDYDHVCVECSLVDAQGKCIPFRDVIARLKRTGLDVSSFLRHMFSLWDEVPLIIRVNEQSDGSYAKGDFVLICATSNDAEMIYSKKFMNFPAIGEKINIVMNFISIFPYTPEPDLLSSHSKLREQSLISNNSEKDPTLTSNILSSNSSSSHLRVNNNSNKHECILFWDLNTCPLSYQHQNKTNFMSKLQGEDDFYMSTILQNLDRLLCHYVHGVYGMDCEFTERIVYLPPDHEKSPKISRNHARYLQQRNFKLVQASGGTGIEVSIRSSIGFLSTQYEHLEKKPTVCLMIGVNHALMGSPKQSSRDKNIEMISSIVSTLRLYGFDVILIYDMNVNTNITPGSPAWDSQNEISKIFKVTTVSWTDIRCLHSYSIEQKNAILLHMTKTAASTPRKSIVTPSFHNLSQQAMMMHHENSSTTPPTLGSLANMSALRSRSMLFDTDVATVSSGSAPSSTNVSPKHQEPGFFSSDTLQFPGLGVNAMNSFPEPLRYRSFSQPSMSTFGQFQDFRGRSNTNPHSVSEVVDLLKFSIATHFKNLQLWRENPDNNEGAGSTLLFGEDGSGGPEDFCPLRFDVDSRFKRQNLYISGPSLEIVQKRLHRVQHMLKQVSRVRKVHKLLGWRPDHREAIMGSNPLSYLQNKCKATVVFHSSESTVLVEIVALTNSCHHELLKAIENLHVLEDLWTFPISLIREVKEKQLIAIRQKYALKIDRGLKSPSTNLSIGNNTMNQLSIQVYGFGKLIGYMHQLFTKTLTEGNLDALIANDSQNNINMMFLSVEPSPNFPTFNSGNITKIFTFQNKDYFIYFSTFQDEFKHYFNVACGVLVSVQSDSESNNALSNPPSNQNSGNSSGMVEIRGLTNGVLRSVQYLEQLQASLYKKVVYFPRATSDKYKTLLELKSTSETMLTDLREANESLRLSNSADSGDDELILTVPADPNEVSGMVSIRIRPPIHSRGIKRMTFPADTTVTLCSIVHSAAQRDIFQKLEDQFSALFLDLCSAEVEVAMKSVCGRKLSVRALREEFVTQSGLMGLRWEQNESDPTGRAKLWGSNASALDTILVGMCADSSVVLLSRKESLERKPSFYNQVKPDGNATGPSPVALGETTVSPPPDLHSPLTRRDSKSNVKEALKGVDPKDYMEALIRWPQPAFRYLFLSESLKKGLNSLLESLRLDGGERIRITCPYRDKKDASICMLLEGHQELVIPGEQQINSYLYSINDRLCTISLACSQMQLQRLLADDLAQVKKIQGALGVHLILEPLSADLTSICARHDLRIMRASPLDYYDVDLVVISLPCVGAYSSPNSAIHQQSSVQVSVAYTKADSPGWSWGVNCLLVVLESNSDLGLSTDEAIQLNRGSVLITSDHATGKTILRVRILPAPRSPANSSFMNSTQADNLKYLAEGNLLFDAIRRGLAQADSLGISGVAVVTPLGLSSLSNLNDDKIRIGVVESIGNFVMKANIYNLNRIVCLEYIQSTELMLDNVVRPLANSPLVGALLSLLESNIRSYLISCCVPLPPSLKYSIRSLSGNYIHSAVSKSLQQPDEKEKIILLRGLDESLRQALSEIRTMLLDKHLGGPGKGVTQNLFSVQSPPLGMNSKHSQSRG